MDVTQFIQGWWQPDSHTLALSLFIRLLGAVYLFAFLSLLVQARGLFGKKGILPIRDYLALARRIGWKRFYYIPTVFWLESGDAAIILVCIAGLAGSALIMAGVVPLIALILTWICYLSFKSAGQDFLNFQWDALLIETGFASIIVVASGFHPITVLLLWFLFFKFMLMAGSVKLNSRDPTWRQLTAMEFHYETQPLPNPLSWYAHQMPLWFQKLSVMGTFFIELVVPFMFFGTPETRIFAFVMEVFLQLMILLTGNYGALNLLTIVLGVPLLGDQMLQPLASLQLSPSPVLPFMAVAAVSVFLILLDCVQILSLFFRNIPGQSLLRSIEQFEISNPYGLFAVMTTKRYEISLEWSNDGTEWNEYKFKWKPQDPSEAPRLSMPHMPRLDWLMWFLPFSSYQDNPWFMRLMEKLLQNSSEVQYLFRRGGPSDPPKMVRALAYEYKFTDWKTKSKTGKWWNRKLVGVYCPPISTLDL